MEASAKAPVYSSLKSKSKLKTSAQSHQKKFLKKFEEDGLDPFKLERPVREIEAFVPSESSQLEHNIIGPFLTKLSTNND